MQINADPDTDQALPYNWIFFPFPIFLCASSQEQKRNRVSRDGILGKQTNKRLDSLAPFYSQSLLDGGF